MTLYRIDANGFYYGATVDGDRSMANCVATPPPTLSTNQTDQWSGAVWIITTYITVWDITNSQKLKITQGTMTTNQTLIDPSSTPYPIWSNGAWITDTAAQNAAFNADIDAQLVPYNDTINDALEYLYTATKTKYPSDLQAVVNKKATLKAKKKVK
jgi:hypothetical protein